MIQLWAWEYKGKTEFGYEISRGYVGIRRFMRIDSLTSGLMHDERFITNLRKVKVVDEDAITISKAEVDEITSMTIQTKPQSCAEEAIGFYRAKDTILRILRHSVVTEPKNFGVIVEAEVEQYPDERQLFVRGTVGTMRPWFAKTVKHKDFAGQDFVFRYNFLDLINPAIISEGVEG